MTAKMDDFLDFVDKNDQVYYGLCRLADEVLAHGYTLISMRLLYEKLRWEGMIETEGGDYNLPNNWVPAFSRLLMYLEPAKYGDLFVTAQCKWWREEKLEASLSE